MSEGVERPSRPLLPLSLWALLASLAVMRGVLAADADPALLVGVALPALALGVTLALTLGRIRGREWAPAVCSVVASAALAVLACAGELEGQGRVAAALSGSPVSSWELRVESDMSEGSYGWRGRASVWWSGERGGEVWLLADEPIDLGDIVRCVGRFSGNAGDEWGASSRSQGLCGTIRVTRVLEERPAEGLWGFAVGARAFVLDRLDASSSDGRALVAGAVCGSTSGMAERGLDALFSECGISHLVAVSGGHLVLVSSIVGALMGRLRLPRPVGAVALLSITGAFVLFCGAPDSAVRSWVMSLVAALSGLFGRRSHPLSSAGVVGLGMALLEPGVTGRLGFLLSVACVCGICALAPYVSYALRVLLASPEPAGGLARMPGPLRRAGDAALEALSMTLVSQVVTAPLICSTFGTLSLVAPLANVLLGPLFSVLLVLGMAVAALSGVPPLLAAALWCCEAVATPLVAAARLLAGLPGACVAVSVDEGFALALLAAALAALLVTWPRLTRLRMLAPAGAIAVAGMCLFLRWRLLAPACVRVLDVGQADAILVTDGASAVLVDAGLDESVVEALARSNVVHLDAVVLTHLHDDHVGGLEDVIAAYGVPTVLVAEGVEPDAPGAEVRELSQGDVVRVGGFSLTVVSPRSPVDGLENEDSLVLDLSFDDGSRSLTALLTGDAEAEVIGGAVDGGLVSDVDLLKVGHHGSAASVTPELARALDPEVSVASAGEGNSYGHPDPTCVEALEGAGSVFLCTKDVGDVRVEPGADGPVVSCRGGGP